MLKFELFSSCYCFSIFIVYLCIIIHNNKKSAMQITTRNEAIQSLVDARTMSDGKRVTLEQATKIVNRCEGIFVKNCIPAHVTDVNIVVYISTTDGRSWESIFSPTGVFRYNRAVK